MRRLRLVGHDDTVSTQSAASTARSCKSFDCKSVHRIRPLTGSRRTAARRRRRSHILVREGSVHGQHQTAGEHALDVGQADLEAQLLELVDGLAAPLDQRPDPVLLEISLQVVAAIGLDLIVLEHVEVVRVAVGRRGQHQFPDVAKLSLVERGDLLPVADFLIVASQLEVEEWPPAGCPGGC